MTGSKSTSSEIIGVSGYIKGIRQEISEAAKREGTVLIQGPTGTGKEIIANAIHAQSKRSEKPFVPVNCGAIPKDIFESEVFGHIKGAFTGANQDKPGKIDAAANGGMLFLDEVGELSMELQVKLLRFLQNGSYYPVGDNKPKKADTRIIAATNQDLLKKMQGRKRSFRDDFFHRINAYEIYTEPLVKHREDLICLINHFFFDGKQMSDEEARVRALLYSHKFDGNVRELKNYRDIKEDYRQARKKIARQWEVEIESGFGYDIDLNSFWPISSQDILEKLKRKHRQTACRFRTYINTLKWLNRNDIDFKKSVRAYEVITLRQETAENKSEIARILNIRNETLSPAKFREYYSFDLPNARQHRYYVTHPMNAYPNPMLAWAIITPEISKHLEESELY